MHGALTDPVTGPLAAAIRATLEELPESLRLALESLEVIEATGGAVIYSDNLAHELEHLRRLASAALGRARTLHATIEADDDTPPALEVCVDCYCYAAGMGESLDDDTLARIATAYAERGALEPECPSRYGRCRIVDGDRLHCDGAGFSWQPCDYCGSALGGDRMHAVLRSDLEAATSNR